MQDDKRFVQATQKHLAGTGIGSFSDRLRDAVRGGSPFDGGDTIRKTQGFGNGALVDANEMDGVDRATALHQADLVRLGMAGNLKDFILTDKDGMPKKGPTSTTTVNRRATPRIRPKSRTTSTSTTTRPCSTT